MKNFEKNRGETDGTAALRRWGLGVNLSFFPVPSLF